MTATTLFPVEPDELEVHASDSADVRRRKRADQRIRAGTHPFGAPLLEPSGQTCGDCVHPVSHQHNSRAYWKCPTAGGVTRGAGTDLRIGWPACALFEARP